MSPAERLTPERERDLVIAAEAGDPEACRALVEAFLPAIGGLARRFPGGIGVDRRELVQEGVAGLLFAARRYDAGLGTPFWAYATFWVRKAMQELVAELTRPVALSDRAVRGLAHMRRARSDHVRIHGAEPTLAELSAATGLTPEQLESLRALERTPRAIEQPLEPSGEGAATVGDAIVDPLAELAYDQVLDHLEIHAGPRLRRPPRGARADGDPGALRPGTARAEPEGDRRVARADRRACPSDRGRRAVQAARGARPTRARRPTCPRRPRGLLTTDDV